jgi:hypothetical protein
MNGVAAQKAIDQDDQVSMKDLQAQPGLAGMQ